MNAKQKRAPILAVFPVSDNQLEVVYREAVPSPAARTNDYHLKSGATVQRAEADPGRPGRVRLWIEPVGSTPVRVDSLSVGGLQSPPFIHGVQTPMELKVPYTESLFPYASTLIDKHVTVMCCTGCNGGVHGRGFVVLNNHSGGGWSSIWVKTRQSIGVPYPRWQRVLFAGGVLSEMNGSTTVVDHGWMIVQKVDEPAHHAPPPLPIETVDLPEAGTRSLLAKSLDATWVQFSDVVLRNVRAVPDQELAKDDLPKTVVEFTDRSGGASVAWLYQSRRIGLKAEQRLAHLRGFVHAEEPGRYVLLSDKDEDLPA